MRIRMTDERERRLKQLLELSSENTKAGAIDAAIKHYLADTENKQRVADQLDTELVDELHTPWVPISRNTSVGHGDDQ